MNKKSCVDWRPRVNIDVSEETAALLRRLPHGTQKVLLSQLMDAIARELERDPASFITAVISREVNIRELLRLKGTEDGT